MRRQVPLTEQLLLKGLAGALGLGGLSLTGGSIFGSPLYPQSDGSPKVGLPQEGDPQMDAPSTLCNPSPAGQEITPVVKK